MQKTGGGHEYVLLFLCCSQFQGWGPQLVCEREIRVEVCWGEQWELWASDLIPWLNLAFFIYIWQGREMQLENPHDTEIMSYSTFTLSVFSELEPVSLLTIFYLFFCLFYYWSHYGWSFFTSNNDAFWTAYQHTQIYSCFGGGLMSTFDTIFTWVESKSWIRAGLFVLFWPCCLLLFWMFLCSMWYFMVTSSDSRWYKVIFYVIHVACSKEIGLLRLSTQQLPTRDH